MQKRFTQPEKWVWGSFTNGDGAIIRTGVLAAHKQPLANAIVLTGLSEPIEKYFETARRLSKLGYNVYMMDWRGQGGSDRYLSDKFKRHSLGFDRDKRDLLQFIDTIVRDNAPKVALSHSMGIIPIMMALCDRPGLFKAVTPLGGFLGFQHALLRNKEKVFSRLPIKRWEKDYIPGGGPWMPRPDKEEGNRPEDFSSYPGKMHLHDILMAENPDLRIGDVTLGFVQHAAKAITDLRKPGIPEGISTPFLFVTAGQESIVNNNATFAMAKRLPNARHLHVPEARHEILMESPALLRPVMREIHGFFKANL